MDQNNPVSHRPIFIAAAALIGIFILVIASIAGCEPAPAPLPEGIQTVRGVLERADLSLKRSGTHRLLVDGKPLYFVESSLVNLRVNEGREADFEGTLVHNIDPKALPVLVVSRVIGGAAEETRSWMIPSLQLSLSVPRSYRGVIEGTIATFTASGSLKPALVVRSEPLASLPFDFRTLRAGSDAGLTLSPLVIANRKAVSVLQAAKGLFAVYVDMLQQSSSSSGAGGAQTVISLTFTLDPAGAPERMADDALKVAQSLRFTTGSSSSRRSPAVSASGSLSSGSGAPCGGAAGILCPAGFYCSITDRENDIGVCTRI